MPDYRKTIGRMNALSSNRALGAGPQREDQAGLTELDRLPGLANLAPEGASALRCAPQGTASEAERDAYWQGLLAFFRTGKGGGEEAISPALMTPFQEGSHLGTIFPLWAPDANTWAESPPGPSYRPLTLEELLQNALSAFAPEEGDAPLLKRQLPRFLRILRHLAQGTGPLAAEKLWADGAEELQKELQLKGVEALMLTGELNQLRKALPAGGVLIPFPPYAPLLLLSLLLAYEGAYRSARLSALAEAHIPPLQELLAVEKEKQPQAKDPEPMGSADVLPGKEGSHERFFRLYKALDILQAYQRAAQKPKSYLFSEEGLEEQAGIDTAQWFAHCERHRTSIGNLFESARSSFEASMSAMASFWAALRIARLESDNAYQPAVHDDFFAAFDWRVFSEEEMALSPPTLLLVSDSALLGPALPAFSELLQANLPVKVVSFPELRSAVSLRAHALEPVALALAHRNAFVLQGSAVAPGALLGGMQKGLCRPVPALFYLLGMEGAGHEAYRNAMAAVEGRAFPGLVYDPLGGSQWGSRFTLIQNPDSGQDWPVHAIKMQMGTESKAEQVAFTFVDFAGSLKRYAPHFKIVPPAFWTPSLVSVADYGQLPEPERAGKVPFIWVLDGERQLQKAAVAWPLMEKNLRQLDFWQYLQENAGVRSFHALRAAEQRTVEMESEFEQRVHRLQGEHRDQLQSAKDDAAREAMENLAAVLLDWEAAPPVPAQRETAPVPQPSTPEQKPGPVPVAETPAPPVEVTVKVAPAAGPIAIAAWIDTPLCTSCSECVDAEPTIFQYNDDKQAFVANPRGGSFGDLVKAAERCPVSIIHPGTPWDKDDPDLPELLERAKPFA